MHKPTVRNRGFVEAWVQYGVPLKNIAHELDISAPTLRKYYEKEITQARHRANAAVAGTLFRLATGDPDRGIDPHPPSAMFWLKTRAGWREKHHYEIVNAEQSQLSEDKATIDLQLLDGEELKIYEKLLLKACNQDDPISGSEAEPGEGEM